VDVPDVKVDVDVPNVEVTVPDVRVAVDVPAVEVDVPDVEVAVDAPDVIRGSGNVVTEDRPVSDFNRVSLIGVGDVIITQGEEESLTVGADDNLMQYIKTEVKNGTLILGFTDEVKSESVKPSKPIKFNLSVREVTGLDVTGVGDINWSSLDTDHLEIAITGVGDIIASSLDTDRLEIVIGGVGDVIISSLTAEELVVYVNGAGDAVLAGQVVKQGVFINGAGDYLAAKLKSQAAVVEVNGAGKATVWATDTLDVRIPGPGKVECYGDPQVTKNISIVGG
jgi:hypothetical protein